MDGPIIIGDDSVEVQGQRKRGPEPKKGLRRYVITQRYYEGEDDDLIELMEKHKGDRSALVTAALRGSNVMIEDAAPDDDGVGDLFDDLVI